MSPPRGGRSALVFPHWLAIPWPRVAATGPGLLPLRLRVTLFAGLSATGLSVIPRLLDRPITDFAFCVVLSMVGPFGRRGRSSHCEARGALWAAT